MLKLLLSSMALGIGLAVDASIISMANGMNDQLMRKKRMFIIAAMFAIFQGLMPILGYIIGHTAYTALDFIEKYHILPIISLIILSILGLMMLIPGIKYVITRDEIDLKFERNTKIPFKIIFNQAIATSIDALSVGVVISDYTVSEAIICVVIIALVTFAICLPSVLIGKKIGLKLGPFNQIVGGLILIIIGLVIFFTGIF